MQKWSVEDFETLKTLYYSGKPIREIGILLNRSEHSIEVKLRKVPNREKLSLDVQKIVELYKNGIDGVKISKLFNCSVHPIYTLLKANNVEIERIPKYCSDKNYFKVIDTEDKAYLLGFIMADGCIYKNTLIINISKKDREINEFFKFYLKSNAPIKDFLPNKREGKTDNEISRLEINSKKLISDLKNLGVGERKTFKTIFPEIPQELYNHFIRGYFDGDGCVSIDKTNTSSFSLAGTHDLLKIIQEILENNCKLSKVKLHTKGKIGFLQYGGNIQVPRIGEWLYKEATIFLKRKKDKFNDIKRI